MEVPVLVVFIFLVTEKTEETAVSELTTTFVLCATYWQQIFQTNCMWYIAYMKKWSRFLIRQLTQQMLAFTLFLSCLTKSFSLHLTADGGNVHFSHWTMVVLLQYYCCTNYNLVEFI